MTDSIHDDEEALSPTDSEGAPPPNATGAAENPWGGIPDAAEPDTATASPEEAENPWGGIPDAAEPDTATASPEEQDGPNPKKGPPPKPPQEDHKDRRIRALEEIIEERDDTLREYIAAHKSEKANMQAFKQRLIRDQGMELKAAAAKRAEALVTVLDNLFMSVEACRNGGELDALIEGVEIVANQFLTTLKTEGLRKIDPEGEPFDPNTMEAMTVIPVSDAKQDNVVLSTVRPGYWLGDRELRPAQVTVGRLP